MRFLSGFLDKNSFTFFNEKYLEGMAQLTVCVSIANALLCKVMGTKTFSRRKLTHFSAALFASLSSFKQVQR